MKIAFWRKKPAFSQDALLGTEATARDWTDFWADHAPGRSTLLQLGTWLDLECSTAR